MRKKRSAIVRARVKKLAKMKLRKSVLLRDFRLESFDLEVGVVVVVPVEVEGRRDCAHEVVVVPRREFVRYDEMGMVRLGISDE